MEDKIKIIDNSGDKSYFTIIPNYILNHSTADEQALYLQMKRLAGEDGKCFATQETLAKKLGWGGKRLNREKVREVIRQLLKRGWIKSVGTIAGKTHPINVYKIIDLWQLNSEYYKEKKGRKNRHFSEGEERRDGKTVLSRDGKTVLEEEPLIKKKNATPEVVAVYPTLLDRLLKGSQRHIQIIGIWAQETGLELSNERVYKSVIKRNLRAAKLLEGYRNEDIVMTIAMLKNVDYLKGHFTLETCYKFVDDIVKEHKKEGPKIEKWEEIHTPDGIKMRPIYAKRNLYKNQL